jgi:hypothetical protein
VPAPRWGSGRQPHIFGRARTRRPPCQPSQSRSVMAATEATSGRHRPVADGVLHAYGLGCLRDPESRPGGPARKGYVMVWAPSHPKAGTGYYVFEHILVMEQVLGRGSRRTKQCITATGCVTITDLRTWSYGLTHSHLASGSATRLPGRARSSPDMGTNWTPPTMLRVSTEHSWRWRESNPRPSVHHQGFSGCSLLCFSQPRQSRRQAADGLSRC